ncbi:Lipase (class 3) [Symmachiella macrocystis]|uniref:Lipase (Class 3) n=1 Tax=Symmachiella macrocystis TaxID=2527985 RepID=A0A5C6BDL2_9PLAN|nr:lipase family protein [Symmachiella macrocystis]TWU09707.1 Lipase (class 3) [Symmachiella macrocystis]
MSSSLVPKVIQDVGEVPLVLHSDVREPLASLSFLRRGLVLAELAMIAYNDEAEASRAAEAIGFPESQLFEHDGAQAYRFANDQDVVLACRGTEANEWNDLKADANASMAVVGALGKVHSGFNQEVDDLWPVLEGTLREDTRPVWFCGHSLGAAMATICAYRCTASAIVSNPQELHTYGSPRIGNKRYLRHAQLSHYRWVHNNDVVTRVPPAWLGYRHGGDEVYLDRHGRIRNLKGVWRSRDRWRGFVAGLFNWKFDLLADHSIHLYAKHIATAAVQEDKKASTGRETRDEDDLVIRNKQDEPEQND